MGGAALEAIITCLFLVPSLYRASGAEEVQLSSYRPKLIAFSTAMSRLSREERRGRLQHYIHPVLLVFRPSARYKRPITDSSTGSGRLVSKSRVRWMSVGLW